MTNGDRIRQMTDEELDEQTGEVIGGNLNKTARNPLF